MDAMGIVLLIGGAIVFIVSFFIPVRSQKESVDIKKLAEEEVKDVISNEMVRIEGQMNEMSDTALENSMEKTERALERISNEKIMAVNEYSNTVIEDINKNHKEVLFLYDMLNDKHKSVKSTVSEVVQAIKKAEDIIIQPMSLQQNLKQPAEMIGSEQDMQMELNDKSHVFLEEDLEKMNDNARILEMYKQGKSKVAIAQELNLGVGEVKLVIDLFKGV